MSDRDYHMYDSVYPWHERQCWQCGYTPACCSCKWRVPFDLGDIPKSKDAYGWCVNPVQNKGLKAGRHQVTINQAGCFQFEWMHEGGQIELNFEEGKQ